MGVCVLPDRIQDVHWSSKRHSGRPRAKCSRSCPFWNTWGSVLPTAWSPFITVNPKDPKNLADFEDLQSPASGSPSPRPKAPILLDSLLTLVFTHLWWPWWSPWCSSPGKKLVTCFFKMTSSTINLRPLDQSQKRSMDHLTRDHFEEAAATENSFCFPLLRKVRPSRERPICPQQEIRGEPGLLALQAKGYHRFNWEEVTIDVPWLMARPWYTITSI